MADNGWRSSPKVLGASLLKTEDDVVLAVGKDSITRRDVAVRLGHTHVAALRRVAAALEAKAKADGTSFRSLREAARRVTVDDLAERKGIGVTSVFAWMTLIETLDVNPVAWLEKDEDVEITLPTRHRHARQPKEKGEKS